MDLTAIKSNQQKMWGTGDYGLVATPLAIVSETLCEALDLHAGWKVLDVATGSGNTAIAAARRRCEVIGIDYVPSLLERARERAAVERLKIEFMKGDAEAIPFADASFHVVTSTFGAMFAPDQQKTADELLRVCRPGGKIGMANWTPDGFVGEWFRTTSKYAPPPPPGLAPPVTWGTEQRLHELFGERVKSISIDRRHFVLRYRSAREWLDYFRQHFGPTRRTFEALEPADQDRLAAESIEILNRFNRSDDSTIITPAEYLEVIAIKAS